MFGQMSERISFETYKETKRLKTKQIKTNQNKTKLLTKSFKTIQLKI